jgi:hypothetical protein
MRLFGIPATIMSLGGIAIALGMAVDAELVALEACHRRLETDTGGWTPDGTLVAPAPAGGGGGRLRAGDPDVAGDRGAGVLPVFAFGGETGRLLRPLALTKTLVILLAAAVTLTVAPALRDRLLRGRIRPELGNPLTRTLVRAYRPFVHFALRRPSPHAADRRAGGAVVPADSFSSRERIPAPPRRRRPLLHADDRAGQQPRRRPVRAGGHKTVSSPSSPVSMRCTERSAAPRRRPIPRRSRWRRRSSAQAAVGVAARRHEAVVFGLGDRPRQTRVATRVAREPAHDDGGADRQRGRQGARAGLDERLDGAGARPHRHDGDRRAHAGGDPDRRPDAGAAGRARSGGAGCGGTRAGHAQRRLRGAWAARRGRDSSWIEPRSRATTSIRRRRARSPTWCWRAATWASWPCRPTPPPRRRPMRVRLSLSAPWLVKQPQDLVRDATVRAGATRRPAGAARAARALDVGDGARDDARRGGQLSGYVYVDLEDGTDIEGYVGARPARRRGRVGPTLQAAAGERLEWTGQYKLLTAGQRRLQLIVPLVAL